MNKRLPGPRCVHPWKSLRLLMRSLLTDRADAREFDKGNFVTRNPRVNFCDIVECS